MTDNHTGDSHLDRAIDRAVREMMSGEPRADLRQRVLATLAGEPARTAWWPRLAFGSAVVASAVILMLVLVNRPTDRPVDQTIVGTQPSAAKSAVTSAPPEASAVAAPKVADAGQRQAEPQPTRTTARARAVEDRPVQAASLDTGEALVVEPMTQVERLTPLEPIGIAKLDAPVGAASGIKPITVEPIEITPLAPRR